MAAPRQMELPAAHAETERHPLHRNNSTLRHLASLAAGGVAGPLLCAPLDVLRTRMQASDGIIMSAQSRTFSGLWHQLRHEVAAKGIAPLYSGLTPAMLGSTLQFAILLGLNGPIRERVERIAPAAAPHVLTDVVAVALSGVAACAVTNPVWVLKTRMQTAPSGSSGGTTLAMVRQLMRQEGPAALFRGVAPSMMLVSFNVLQLPLYHALKEQGNATSTSVLASVSAATLATYPLQVTRTRFQAERAVPGAPRQYASFAAVVQHAMRAESGLLRTFYAGMPPHLARSLASWYIKFAVAERVSRSIGAERASETGSGMEPLPAWAESGEAPVESPEHAAVDTEPVGGRVARTSLVAFPSPRVSQSQVPSRTSSVSSAGGFGPRSSWTGERLSSWPGAFDGARASFAGEPRRRRRSSVDMLADGLLRARCHAHLATQVLLGSATHALWFSALSAGGPGDPPRAATLALAALFLAVCAAAVHHARKWRDAPSWARTRAERAIANLVRFAVVAAAVASTTCAWSALPRVGTRGATGAALSGARAAAAHFLGAHLFFGALWPLLQLPPRLCVYPEALRAAAALAAICARAVLAPGAQAATAAAFVSAAIPCAAAAALATPLLVSLLDSAVFGQSLAPGGLDVCPVALQAARDRVVTWTASVTGSSLGLGAREPLLEYHMVSGVQAAGVALSLLRGEDSTAALALAANLTLAAAAAAAAASKARGGSVMAIRLLEGRLGLGRSGGGGGGGARPSVAAPVGRPPNWRLLRESVAAAGSERDALRAASSALHALFPGAAAHALGTLSASLHVSTVEAAAREEGARAALAAALPRCVAPSATGTADADETAAAFVCAAAPRRGACVVADSADFPAGAAAFADWRAAGGRGQYVTARVAPPADSAAGQASPAPALGFLVLHFAPGGASAPRFASHDASAADALRRFAETLGEGLAERAARAAAAQPPPPLPDADFTPTVADDDDAFADCERDDDGGLTCALLPSVTIVFANVVGFTTLSAAMPPEAALALLDALWQRFDTLATAHGIAKMDTTGDLYTAVAGMRPPRADHARAAARFAMDLHAAAAATRLEDGTPLQLRVGLHTGTVACGYAGATRPRAQLYGDTMTVAARVAASARPATLQMSSATAEACGLQEGLLERRPVVIRGRGHLETHTVEAAGAQADAVRAALDAAAAAAPPPPGVLPNSPSVGGGLFSLLEGAAGGEDGGPVTADGDGYTSDSELNAMGPLSDTSSPAQRQLAPPRRLVLRMPSFGGWAQQPVQPRPRTSILAFATGSPSPAPARNSFSGALQHQANPFQPGPTPMAGGLNAAFGNNNGSSDSWDVADDAERELRRSATTHLAQQVAQAVLPSLFGALGSALHTRRWERDGGPAAAAFAAAAVPPLVALVATMGVLAAALAARGRTPALENLRWWPHLLIGAHFATSAAAQVFFFGEYIYLPRLNCAENTSRAACAHIFFWTGHVPVLSMTWFIAQMPISQVFFLEVLRSCIFLVCALGAAASAGALTAAYAAHSAALAAASAVALPFFWGMAYTSPPAVAALLVAHGVDTCPRPLHAVRSAVEAASARVRERVLGGRVLLDANASTTVAIAAVLALTDMLSRAARADAGDLAAAVSLRRTGNVVSGAMTVLVAAGALTKLRPSSGAELEAMVAAAVGAEEARALAALRSRLASAPSEAAILRAGAEAARALFPAACGAALGAFAQGAGADVVALCEVAGGSAEEERALRAALPSDVGAVGASSSSSSVARVCHPALARVPLLDSAEAPSGLRDCPDWAAAVAAGLPSERALTAQLNAGPVVVGFVQLHFPRAERGARPPSRAALRELCDAVGGAIFVRRAFAVGGGAGGAGGIGGSVPPAHGPPSIAGMRSTSQRVLHAAAAAAGGDAPPVRAPLSDDDVAALAALDATAAGDAALLRSWSLDAWALPHDEVPRLLVSMLHALDLLRRFRIPPAAAHAFAAAVANHMAANPFHNIVHVFCVSHTAFRFLTNSNARHVLLCDLDVLALLLAAMCHDLEHPGTTNAYQVNTGSALAVRYNDASVLENHHASTAFVLLERTGLLQGLSAEEFRLLRRIMVDSILYTDMSKHRDLLARVTARVDAARVSVAATPPPAGRAEGDGGGSSLTSPTGVTPDRRGSWVDAGTPAGTPLPSLSPPLLSARSMPAQGLRRRSSMTAALAAAALAAQAHLNATPARTGSCAAALASPAAVAAAAVATPPPPSPHITAAPPFSRESLEDRALLVSFLLHCADLCTPLLPPPLSQRVTEELSSEFSRQAELERAAGLPVTVMLASDALSKAKMELGFIDYAVRPLYVTLVAVLPELSSCLTLIDHNRASWSAIVAAAGAAGSSAPGTPGTPQHAVAGST